jgi:hypothetical protein
MSKGQETPKIRKFKMTGLALGLASLGPCGRRIQGKSSRFGPSLLMGLEIAMKSTRGNATIIMDN